MATREEMVSVLQTYGVFVPDSWDRAEVERAYEEITVLEPAAAPPPAPKWKPGSPRG